MSRAGDINIAVEFATAKNFIHWYNRKTDRNLSFSKKQETPDFIYADENGEIGLEVTTAYYNQDHARVTAEWFSNLRSCLYLDAQFCRRV